MTTVTAIKNRLKKNKYYYTVRIPVLQNLGCELLMASMINLNPGTLDKDKLDVHEEVLGEKVPEVIYSIIDSDVGFFIGISKNFSELYDGITNMERLYKQKNIIDISRPSYYFFPFQHSRIYNFFDYAPIIKFTFNLSVKGEDEEALPDVMPKTDLTKLSNVEKRVLYGLIRYPDIPDSKIADKIDVTRQVVSRLRKSFEYDGILKTLKIPNLKILGYEILAISHFIHNPNIPPEDRGKGIKEILSDFPQIFIINGNQESLMINISRDFTEFQELKNKAHAHLRKNDFIIGEPKTFVFSIPKLRTIVEHNYATLVEKILDLNI
jgi:DNA-binding Lrp family transcriptional regulator